MLSIFPISYRKSIDFLMSKAKVNGVSVGKRFFNMNFDIWQDVRRHIFYLNELEAALKLRHLARAEGANGKHWSVHASIALGIFHENQLLKILMCFDMLIPYSTCSVLCAFLSGKTYFCLSVRSDCNLMLSVVRMKTESDYHRNHFSNKI